MRRVMERYGLDHPDKYYALPVGFLADEAQFMELEAEVAERQRKSKQTDEQMSGPR